VAEALYMDDCYLKEFEAEVKQVKDDKFIVLDKTAFYPNGGGQPWDTGKMVVGSDEYNVVFTGKFSGEISHEVDKPGLKVGDKVKCTIDWDRRHKLMRMHTAAHIVSAVFHKEAGALITGGNLDLEKSRADFNIENFDREKIDDYFRISNEIVDKDIPIKIYSLSREEAEKDPAMFKLAKGLPEAIKTIRVVDIEGYDRQADGGTHVKSTIEVGKIKFLKAENKGKANRRVYYCLE